MQAVDPFWNRIQDTHRTALITPAGEHISYRELYDRADSAVAPLGDSPQLVFLRCKNTPQVVAAYLGCLRHGHVALLLNAEIEQSMFERMLAIYEPNYIFSGEKETPTWQHYSDTPHADMLHPDLALLLSTSGSTGSPKLVRLTKKNLQANAASIAEYLQLTAQERPVTNLPLYYSYGLSVINSHLLVGAGILLTADSLISPRFWTFCDENGVTSLSGVPYTYDMLEAVGFRKRPLPTLRSMTQAGGHMPQERVLTYANWAQERGIRLYIMYGQTEATARMSYLPPDLAAAYPGSIGIAVPGGTFSLRDAKNDLITTPDTPGELIYHGDNVSMGYAETKEDLSLGDTNCGTLHTGDMATVNEQGLYYITGRLKRFLKIAGNRFGLDELEAHFHTLGIEAVCGGSDGKMLIAVTQESQKEAVSATLKSTWHLLRNQYRIIVVDSIPRSATGKILYQQLFS